MTITELRETGKDCRTYYNNAIRACEGDTLALRMQRDAHMKAFPLDFRVVQNDMYRELENLINANQPENAGILLAAIICQDRMDDDHQVDWDRDTFIEAIEGDLP